jgi:hypothetical protein
MDGHEGSTSEMEARNRRSEDQMKSGYGWRRRAAIVSLSTTLCIALGFVIAGWETGRSAYDQRSVLSESGAKAAMKLYKEDPSLFKAWASLTGTEDQQLLAQLEGVKKASYAPPPPGFAFKVTTQGASDSEFCSVQNKPTETACTLCV